jgi:DNA modification methylase
LVERLVLVLTKENDIVLDPFVGVGSSLIAANTIHNQV